MAEAKERLARILKKHPYLNNEIHSLNGYVQDVRGCLEDADAANDILDRIESELEAEERTLAAAFKRFDQDGGGELVRTDVKHMVIYLGFPSSEADIDKLMSLIDVDSTGSVSFDEFRRYVGTMGGTVKLFEERRKRMRESGGGTETEEQRLKLQEAGIDQEAQAYWRLVVPPSEFTEAAKLVKCQQEALTHIRNLARTNHDSKLKDVQTRVLGMGFKDEHLWMTLAWIRECAPILVHLNLDKLLQFIESDTHYRNQFETSSSGGLLKPKVREKWERDLFGGCYDGANGFDRCKYGVLNVMNDYRGVVKCAQYGDSYVILKNARLRCTFSPEDSANLKAQRLAVLDYYAHVLNEYTDAELKETIEVANPSLGLKSGVGDSSMVLAMKYKESQVHGELAFDRHVERLVVATRHKSDSAMSQRISRVCAKHGWKFSWMDEEKDRLKKEEEELKGKAGPVSWEERLAKLEREGAPEVKEGYCKVGCGRKVAPGTNPISGRPWKTCCKGCIMGFGHDYHCEKVDPSKLGPGLCKLGCGRKVAAGKDSKNRPLQTCCRGCAMGLAHSRNCGGFKVRLCKQNCGRAVAPGLYKGKPFSTCCRQCALGKGHSPECIAELPPQEEDLERQNSSDSRKLTEKVVSRADVAPTLPAPLDEESTEKTSGAPLLEGEGRPAPQCELCTVL